MQMLSDLMNLSYVPRWAVVNMRRPQSVAEHSYRVACITMGLVHCCEERSIIIPQELLNDAIAHALVHDAAETYTSDVPRPFKDIVGRDRLNDLANKLVDWYIEPHQQADAIVKIADNIEGWTWWLRHGDSSLTHPCITPAGPISLNEESVVMACIDHADDLSEYDFREEYREKYNEHDTTPFAQILIEIALEVVNTITGAGNGPANKLANEIKARQYFTRIRSDQQP